MAAATAVGALLGTGCGPAPYTIGPEEPPRPGPSVVQVFIGEAPPAPQGAPEDRWIPDGLPRPNPFADRRTWVGEYQCPQGRTDLAVRVVDVHGPWVRAVFDFHHAPTDVSGQFLMSGQFDEQNGTVVFTPGTWIIHPDDYETVGMLGSVSRDGSRFSGRIAHAGCGAFRLRAAR
jgi:hypothetical protein